jgi:hypothetical protein
MMLRDHAYTSRPNAGMIVVGCEIRCRPADELSVDRWERLLALLNRACAPEPLVQYSVKRAETISRLRPFAGVSTLSRVLKRGGVAHVALEGAGASMSLADSNVPNHASAVLTFSDMAPNPRLSAVRLGRFVSPSAPLMSTFLRSIQEIFTDLGEATGQIHVSWETAYARNETSAVYSWSSDTPYADENCEARVERLAPYRAANDLRVFGAYWGTLLNPSQVEALGGVLQVPREAPVALTEVLDGGAMYLQLTPVPEPISTPTMRAGLPQLETYLAPISVPVPYFRVGANEAWGR